jgi:hypothetical protein
VAVEADFLVVIHGSPWDENPSADSHRDLKAPIDKGGKNELY